MHSQSTALNEAFIAVFDGAVIGSLICVDAVMATEIGLAIKRLEVEIQIRYKRG